MEAMIACALQWGLFMICKSALLFTLGGALERIWSELHMNKNFYCPPKKETSSGTIHLRWWSSYATMFSIFPSDYYSEIWQSETTQKLLYPKKKERKTKCFNKKEINTVLWMAVRIHYRHGLLHSSRDRQQKHFAKHPFKVRATEVTDTDLTQFTHTHIPNCNEHFCLVT